MIQLFVVNGIQILRNLKDRYAVSPAITPLVQVEIVSTATYRDRFAPVLTRAVANGTITVLDDDVLSRHLRAQGHSERSAQAYLSSMRMTESNYVRHVDRGEASTFATAVELEYPAASNDASAIRTLGALGLRMPIPVLRCFDLVAFGHQVGLIDAGACERIRRTLMENREHVPGAFKNNSFADGLVNFIPRLIDGSRAAIGAPPPDAPPEHATVLNLNPV